MNTVEKTNANMKSSDELLKIISNGNLSKEDAIVIATILEERFPTPVMKQKKVA